MDKRFNSSLKCQTHRSSVILVPVACFLFIFLKPPETGSWSDEVVPPSWLGVGPLSLVPSQPFHFPLTVLLCTPGAEPNKTSIQWYTTYFRASALTWPWLWGRGQNTWLSSVTLSGAIIGNWELVVHGAPTVLTTIPIQGAAIAGASMLTPQCLCLACVLFPPTF